jgi:hypothetical protein
METNARSALPAIMAKLELGELPADWSGVDAVLPLLERIRQDGGIVLLKLDGERTANHYTAVVCGAVLGENPIRIDCACLEDALATVILDYAKHKWGYSAGGG